ncbi:ParM/StbA family protein [Clostridium tertium]|uniref:ParM/StbA family protein n=1 Tax=Clostridium TaxID=1485 RepID=UPI00232EDFDE|nr:MULTISPECIES: ParM/StbA family protein [Clostridium]MDB1923566.1 ParM/StbA family protein [Clostridium tertium]MDB1930767.1 ParM/StbA family protein [Clostridium tertium]MDU7948672.1 ParM/StbA family protein [Clostridium sp.]
MIRAVDIGNFATKDNLGNIFESKVSSVGNILSNKYEIVLNDELYYLGEGSYDTEYRKIKKDSYLKLLFGILALGSKETEVQLVLGLPLSQYKADKQKLIEMIMSNCYMFGSINGEEANYIITDVEIYPEGIAAIPSDYEGIVVDIGGRTTDCCLTYIENGRRKIENPISLPTGTIKLYSELINRINSKFSLDLEISNAKRIIKNGLNLYGKKQDIAFIINIFKDYLEELIRQLNVAYSINSNNICFTGGGSLELRKPILKRINHAIISDNAVFDNAKGFYEVGCKLWH